MDFCQSVLGATSKMLLSILGKGVCSFGDEDILYGLGPDVNMEACEGREHI